MDELLVSTNCERLDGNQLTDAEQRFWWVFCFAFPP